MHEWIKVVADPLGLAGFALFLVFGFVAKAKTSDERRWLAPLAAFAGVVALAGGLVIAYVRLPKPAATSDPAAKAAQQQTNQVQQSSSGAGSPNVQGVQGNVTLTVDQSTGETKIQKTSDTKTTK